MALSAKAVAPQSLNLDIVAMPAKPVVPKGVPKKPVEVGAIYLNAIATASLATFVASSLF